MSLSTRPPSVPKHLQLKESLKAMISEGYYEADQKFLSESAIKREFDVSTITVRHALRDLQAEGVIYTIKKKGSFIAPTHQMTKSIYLVTLGKKITPEIMELIHVGLQKGLEGKPHLKMVLIQDQEFSKNQHQLSHIYSDLAGVIFYRSHMCLRAMQDSLKNLGVPYVYYGSDIPLGNAIEEFPSVTYHEKSILMSAVDHLVTKGHSSIAFMGSSLIEVDRNRCIQFVETLIQKGFSSPKIFMLQKEFDFDELLKLSRGPEVQEVSAIICSVDRLAIKLAQTLQSTGIKVPEEISIISVDNSFLCDFTYPPLTSIDLMNAQGIQRCVEYLACPKDRKIILQESFAPRVVERESVQELS